MNTSVTEADKEAAARIILQWPGVTHVWYTIPTAYDWEPISPGPAARDCGIDD